MAIILNTLNIVTASQQGHNYNFEKLSWHHYMFFYLEEIERELV